jgi:hypothetical protein
VSVRRLGQLAALALVLGGCGPATVPPEPQEVGPTECPPPYAFAGRASLASLGLGGFGGDSNRVGMVWITQDAVPFVGPGGPGPAAHMVCAEFDDGSGMAASLTEPWQPPNDGAQVEASGEVPVRLVILGVAGLVVLVVSLLAFRRDATPAG